jgi:hypothetical protein
MKVTLIRSFAKVIKLVQQLKWKQKQIIARLLYSVLKGNYTE